MNEEGGGGWSGRRGMRMGENKQNTDVLNLTRNRIDPVTSPVDSD
jgi:hypothetical protein